MLPYYRTPPPAGDPGNGPNCGAGGAQVHFRGDRGRCNSSSGRAVQLRPTAGSDPFEILGPNGGSSLRVTLKTAT